MKKNIQKGLEDEKKRKIIYLSGIGVTIALFGIAIISMIYVGALNNSKEEEFFEIKGLANGTKEVTFTEEASSGIGKSIDEVKKDEAKENENKKKTQENVLVVEKLNETSTVNNTSKTEEIKEDEKIKSVNSENDENQISNKEETKEIEPVFSMPVDGEIIKEFAKDKLVYSDTLREWVTHTGIDIKAEKTSIVKASENGTIKSIKNDPRFGLTIVIEHNMRI